MKCSESWLREWVNPPLTREQLCTTLTMAGLEVEEVMPVAKTFTQVVVGQVLSVEKHPEADRLSVCDVTIGKETLQIVCGAKNVRPEMKVAVALVDAVLPDDKIIKKTAIRNVTSSGMLCSASELGFVEESEGIMGLPDAAPLGMDLKSYLKLDDYVIDLSITPNRGDCLSIKGVAREVSALTHSPLLKNPADLAIDPTFAERFAVQVLDKKGCPAYLGRVIRGVKSDVETPTWLKECLRRSGLRSISLVVDVTNFVMLELGQPMHAFDLGKIHEAILVRTSRAGEQIALLDGTEKTLDAATLVIADKKKTLAIAGVMGGMDSSVTLLTQDIFLESAFFTPEVVARQRQFYTLNSESAYRFERGVDPAIQKQAIERATQLILELAGGQPGPVIEVIDEVNLPQQRVISLSMEKVSRVLGVPIAAEEIEKILQALQIPCQREKNQWVITVPTWRFFDMALPEDVIEEIARVYGYNNIPLHIPTACLNTTAADNHDFSTIRHRLSDLGYREIITYSFVDKKLQTLLDPDHAACELVNPMTADMTVMRTSLWPGLLNAFLYNKNRQQNHIRLFEIGTCFAQQGEQLLQQPKLGGLITGLALPEQWGVPSRAVDFFDLKGDLEQLAQLAKGSFTFKAEKHPALHPGQPALHPGQMVAIYANGHFKGQKIGVAGRLHPAVLQALDISDPVFVYELDVLSLNEEHLSFFEEISKFPEIRRDLAILINQAIPAREIQDTIKRIAGDWLKDVFIFDVYQGKGISQGHKSIAVGMILQHPARTLVDEEITALMERIVSTLKENLGAVLRS